MSNERIKRPSDVRSSIGTFSDFSQNDLDEIDDPISAYFKQRCANSSRTFFQKHPESNRGSSIGVIDVDNVSLFGEGEGSDNESLLSAENLLDQLNRESLNLKKTNRESDASKSVKNPSKSEIEIQRALAQRALRRLSSKADDSKIDTSVLTPKKRESKVLADISSKLMNVKLSMGKDSEKEWFQPNFSPNTPRYFHDELSSFGGEDESLKAVKNDIINLESKGANRESQYAKKINSMLKDVPEISVNSDLEFESQSKEEQINRFEEDEKQFRLENSALLHNSQISQFSGVDGADTSHWSPEALNPEKGAKNLSIGQFFNMRSNRISSLVGSVSDVPILEEPSEASTLSDAQALLSRSECSIPISEISHAQKTKFRRCVSTCDLKRIPEGPKSARYSSDSCSSNSTLMIQGILAEMESGLSGTQIYEKLMKSYGKKGSEGEKEKEKENKLKEKKQKAKKAVENNETPKSSKEPKLKGAVRNIKKDSKSLSTPSAKEKKDDKHVRDKKEVVPSPKIEKVKKAGSNKGFYASTPKTQNAKSPNSKLKGGFGKALMSEEDAAWIAPRVTSIQSIDLNKSGGSEDNDKTVTVNSTSSSEYNKKNSTLVKADTFTIEDTIVAGDLTVLSQRIEEMKRDSVCIVRSAQREEPVLLSVIQKLADLPKGSLDCSALTPLLRDQFPELLANFPTPSKDSSITVLPKPKTTAQDALVASPGSWVQLPGVWGLNEKICACVDLPKTVLVPLINFSENWLLISIDSLDLLTPQGKEISGVKKNDEWCVTDVVVVTFKDTIVPPDSQQSLKIIFLSKISLKFELILTFRIKELMNGGVQTRNVRLLINNVFPENYINVLPKDSINFGVISDQCSDQATVQVSFDGISELPLTIFIEEDDSISKHFILKPYSGHQQERESNMLEHVFYEGEKQVFEFRVVFWANVLLKEGSKTQEFKATLVIVLGTKVDTSKILKKIPIKGSVGFAKFMCNPGCSPLVFRASERGQSVTRSYPLKNIGSLPIAFNISMTDENNRTVEGEDVFVVPKSFYLSRNEESEIKITFNANCNESFTKRFLRLQIKPNGRAIYESELIGIITSGDSRPVSRASGASVSTKSTVNSESGPVRLLTTTYSISWAAVSLDKEARQTFQVKSSSSVTVTVRISFEKNSDAFKLVNENGERVHRLRKVLKPDCPIALTVSFRPDVVGVHSNALLFETGHSRHKNKILLNGVGGIPNLLMKHVKSDLNGCKIVRLRHSRESNEFEKHIEFTNEGRIPAFLLLKTAVKVFSLSNDIIITPSSAVIYPDSSVTVKISQKLRHSDLQQLLSDKEICKIATICVLTGDEPSRLRIKKLVDSEKLPASERLKLFTGPFHGEKDVTLKAFKDSQSFENEFLKSIKVFEIVAVIEKSAEILEETSILDESTEEFISFISDKTVISMGKSQIAGSSDAEKSIYSSPLDTNTTLFSADSLNPVPTHNRITKWLETLDC